MELGERGPWNGGPVRSKQALSEQEELDTTEVSGAGEIGLSN